MKGVFNEDNRWVRGDEVHTATKNIIAMYQGMIRVESQAGNDTRVTVVLTTAGEKG